MVSSTWTGRAVAFPIRPPLVAAPAVAAPAAGAGAAAAVAAAGGMGARKPDKAARVAAAAAAAAAMAAAGGGGRHAGLRVPGHVLERYCAAMDVVGPLGFG